MQLVAWGLVPVGVEKRGEGCGIWGERKKQEYKLGKIPERAHMNMFQGLQ